MNILTERNVMIRETIVFSLDKDYKNFERQVGELSALRYEVELLRSILMEDGKRDVIKQGEKDMYKRYQRKQEEAAKNDEE